MNLEQPRPTPASPQVRSNTGNRGAATTAAASIANAHGSQGASGRNTAFVDLLNLLSAEDEPLLSEEGTDAVSLAASDSTDAADASALSAAVGAPTTSADPSAVAAAANAALLLSADAADDGATSATTAAATDAGPALNLSMGRAAAQVLADAQRLAGAPAATPSAGANPTGTSGAPGLPTSSQAAASAGVNAATGLTNDPVTLMQRLKDAGLAELSGSGASQAAGRTGRGVAAASAANPVANTAALTSTAGTARSVEIADRMAKVQIQNDGVQALAAASAMASPSTANLPVGIGAAVLTGSGWAMPGLAALDDPVSRLTGSAAESGGVSAPGAADAKSGAGQSGQSGGGGSETGQVADWGGWSAVDATPDREQLASADWTQTLAEQLDKWTSQSAQDAELRIESFGGQPVDIAIQMRDGAAWVEFRSDSSGAREALAQSAEQLRQMLEARGVALGHMSVDSQAGRGAGHDSQGDGRQGGSTAPIQIGDSRGADSWLPSHALMPSARSASRAGPRSLDVFA